PPGFIISLNDIQLPDTSGHRHSTPSNSGSELQTPEDSDYDGDVSPGSNEEDDDVFPNGEPLCGSHIGLPDGIPLLGKVEDPPVNEKWSDDDNDDLPEDESLSGMDLYTQHITKMLMEQNVRAIVQAIPIADMTCQVFVNSTMLKP